MQLSHALTANFRPNDNVDYSSRAFNSAAIVPNYSRVALFELVTHIENEKRPEIISLACNEDLGLLPKEQLTKKKLFVLLN